MRVPLIKPADLTEQQTPLYEDMKQGIAANFQGFTNIGTDEQTVRKIFGTKKRVLAFLWRLGADGEMIMKKLLISTVAAALVAAFAMSAEAAGNKQKVSADVQASCKAQAAKKFSAIHFLKRRNFVNNCVAQHANAKAKPAVKPTTTGQAPKQAQ